jgi:hypothetical protein
MPSSKCETQRKCTKLQMEKLLMGRKCGPSMQMILSGFECEHVNKTSVVAQLESQINELKHQLDLLPNDHQSKKQTIKSKLDDLNNTLAKEMISCRFKLEPEQFSPEVSVKHHHVSSKKVTFRCKMKRIPANSNDATTSHKLQGMSKYAIIVSLAAMLK